jgi:hypothetical protein
VLLTLTPTVVRIEVQERTQKRKYIMSQQTETYYDEIETYYDWIEIQSLVNCHNAESPYAAPARRRYLRQIASAAELFPWSDLGMDLTPAQLAITRQWLADQGFYLDLR